MSHQVKAYLLTLLAVIFWSTSASAFKFALQTIAPPNLLLFSTGLSALFLLIILIIQGKMGNIGQIPAKSLTRYLLLGVLNPFLYYLILFKAYALLPGQIAMALNYGWPLVLTVLSVPLLKQHVTGRQLSAIIISFIGAVMIATQGRMIHLGLISQLGVGLAAISTLIWALFWLFNAQDGQDPVVKLFISFSSGLVSSLLFSLVEGNMIWPSAQTWIPLIYIALFEMSLTFILWLYALQLSTDTAKIGNLMYLTPFFSLMCLHLVIGEQIHQATYGGLTVIIGSLIYQAQTNKRAK